MNYGEDRLKPFLFGQLPEIEREEIESAALDSAELFERIEALEAGLAMDYVRGRLSAADRAAFEAAYLYPAGRRQKVADAQALVLAVSAARRSSARRWIATAAAGVVLTAVGSWYGLHGGGAAVPAAPKQAPRMLVVSLRLEPNAVTRGLAGKPPAVLSLPEQGLDGVARIHMGTEGLAAGTGNGPWTAVLSRVDGAAVWQGEARRESSDPAVAVDVPLRALPRGDYVLRLAGPGGVAGSYQFRAE